VLGTGRDELDRLALQHRLWSDAAHAAWRTAGLRTGHRVLDVGCGPGFASFDLAQLVGRSGLVVGVDESRSFIEHLKQQASARSLPQLHGQLGDVQNLAAALSKLPSALFSRKPPERSEDVAPEPLADGFPSGTPGGSFDLAYARWVLCFVPDPESVVRAVASFLAPGGRFVIHDYFAYRTMTMAPRRQSFDRVVAATIESWAEHGGDSDVCARLPRILENAGLRLEHLNVHQRIARGGDTMFAWPDTWWRNYAPKLVAMGLLSQEHCDELFRDLDEVARSTTDFIVCPPVYEIIGVKPATL
jgi:SAM-dependent methyltransferase